MPASRPLPPLVAGWRGARGERESLRTRSNRYNVGGDAFYVEGAKWSGIHHLRSANGETLVYWKPDRSRPECGDVDLYPPERNVDEDRVACLPALTHARGPVSYTHLTLPTILRV